MSNRDTFFSDPKQLKTEERIIYAAMKVFSQYPLGSASIRMIAKEADVTLSLVLYHFKSKENLYQVVFDRIMTYYAEHLQSYFDRLDKKEKFSPEEAKHILCDIVRYTTEELFCAPEANWLAKIALGETLYPSSFYDYFYEKYFKKNYDLIANLVMAVMGITDYRKAFLKGVSILGNIVSFRMERELLVRHLDMTGFSKEEIEELKALVMRSTLLLLEIRPENENC